jgi:hypothetical protein
VSLCFCVAVRQCACAPVPAPVHAVCFCGRAARWRRYEEQKLRLSLCGLGRVMYLVEGDQPHKLSAAHVDTAMHATQVQAAGSSCAVPPSAPPPRARVCVCV